jgi:streptogramin lyase
MRKLIAAAVGIGALAVLPGPGAWALTTHAIGGPSRPLSRTAAALAASARAAGPGAVTEIPLGSNAQIYLFGLTSGPDGNVWFANQGCMGLGHCAIGRLDPSPAPAGTCGSPTTVAGPRSAGSRPRVTSPSSAGACAMAASRSS